MPASGLSGCPSLSVKHTDDPLRDDPVASIDQSCVACGNCGEVADAAVLCPSFYRADVIRNPNRWDLFKMKLRRSVITYLQHRRERKPHELRWNRSLIMPDAPLHDRPLTIAIMAMGGQGGGVLC